MTIQHEKLAFFLGGQDLEMITIAGFLNDRQAVVYDKHLAWGAKLSDYRSELSEAIARSMTPVLVELDFQLEEERNYNSEFIVIDHHGSKAGKDKPTSLEQVAYLFGITPQQFSCNRHWVLVAANDRGHIAQMLALNPPATKDEILKIRTCDLSAQGVSEAMIEQAKNDLFAVSQTLNGALTVLRSTHDRTGLSAEVLEPLWGGPGYRNLLVFAPNQVGFYGDGEIVLRLAKASPQGSCWYGGTLPDHGFWGSFTASLGFDPQPLVVELLSNFADGVTAG